MLSSLFNYPDADLVLRSVSPDPVDFCVHRCILAIASPFFEQMFTLPQSEDDGPDPSRPVIDVTESAATLDCLLRFVYPVVDPSIESLDKLALVLEAACKYEMEGVIHTLRKLLVARHFVEAHPTRVYAIATRFDLEEEAKIASSHTLTMSIMDHPLSDDLKYITAYSYHRLIDLHHRRARAAQELLKLPDNVKCMLCNGTHYGVLLPPKWWNNFVERAKEELAIRPTTDVIFSPSFLKHSAQAGCERCGMSMWDADKFLESLKQQIDALPATI